MDDGEEVFLRRKGCITMVDGQAMSGGVCILASGIALRCVGERWAAALGWTESLDEIDQLIQGLFDLLSAFPCVFASVMRTARSSS